MADYQISAFDAASPSVKKLLSTFQELYPDGKVGFWSFQLSGDSADTIYEDQELPDKTLELLEEFFSEDFVGENCEPVLLLLDQQDEVGEWSASDDETEPVEMTSEFAGEIEEALRALNINMEDLSAVESDFDIHWAESGPFVAEGVLTHLLVSGGVKDEFPGSVDDARKLTGDFIDALIEDRHLQAQVAICDQAWSPWFNDDVGDFTMFLYDKLVKKFHLLCLSDSAEDQE
ncbi:MAG: hypothetical protein R3C11_25935 [Planctomycetaceae bacterium]